MTKNYYVWSASATEISKEHVEPAGFHGEKFDGERGNGKTRLPRKIAIGI